MGAIKEITAKTVLRKHKRLDSWFLSSYTMNLYRGCRHACVYCDGRTEKYRVGEDFDESVAVKVNALELLARELDPARKRKPFQPGYLVICGGVSDAYQPAESGRELTRQTLQLLLRYGHPVHLLTKSSLVERDLPLLKEINRKSRVLVSFSFSTADDRKAALLEPGAASPSARLASMGRCREAGLGTGAFLMPLVPGLTDGTEELTRSITAIAGAGARYLLWGGLTLKAGLQRDYFGAFLKECWPDLLGLYRRLYRDETPWGGADERYTAEIDARAARIAADQGLPRRIPLPLFPPGLTHGETALLVLEQMEYLAALQGRPAPYGRGAAVLRKNRGVLESGSLEQLMGLPGVGRVTAGIVREIAETGGSRFYESLL